MRDKGSNTSRTKAPMWPNLKLITVCTSVSLSSQGVQLEVMM